MRLLSAPLQVPFLRPGSNFSIRHLIGPCPCSCQRSCERRSGETDIRENTPSDKIIPALCQSRLRGILYSLANARSWRDDYVAPWTTRLWLHDSVRLSRGGLPWTSPEITDHQSSLAFRYPLEADCHGPHLPPPIRSEIATGISKNRPCCDARSMLRANPHIQDWRLVCWSTPRVPAGSLNSICCQVSQLV